MRILILIAIGLLLYVIISSQLKKIKREKQQESIDKGAENMVRCHHCGLHILEKEAIKQDGKAYCSEEHVEADK